MKITEFLGHGDDDAREQHALVAETGRNTVHGLKQSRPTSIVMAHCEVKVHAA